MLLGLYLFGIFKSTSIRHQVTFIFESLHTTLAQAVAGAILHTANSEFRSPEAKAASFYQPTIFLNFTLTFQFWQKEKASRIVKTTRDQEQRKPRNQKVQSTPISKRPLLGWDEPTPAAALIKASPDEVETAIGVDDREAGAAKRIDPRSISNAD